MSSIKSVETIFSFISSQAKFLAFPKGGSPASVGKYFSTSGSSSGNAETGKVYGIPSL